MTEIFYRTNGKESYRETDEDWAEVCNKARAHLFPEVTDEQISQQNFRLAQIMAKPNGK